jgi:glycogen debranching enzyme
MSANDPFLIIAESGAIDERTHVLKHGDTFGVFDHYGDIRPGGLGEQGLFHDGTRHLSAFFFLLESKRPLFLSSTMKDDNNSLGVDVTNPDVAREGEVVLPRGTLHVSRSTFLWNGVCYHRIRIKNYGLEQRKTTFSLHFRADFADIFEVRGVKREKRGEVEDAVIRDASVTLPYRGLDGHERRTRVDFSQRPDDLVAASARFDVSLPPKGEATYSVTITAEGDEAGSPPLSYENALAAASAAIDVRRTAASDVVTSNEQMNRWLARTFADLHMMLTDTPTGPYPYAGTPWYSTAFGRDGIIAALECLWLRPDVARGVLDFLASTQATEVNPDRDAEPGKILHETRGGEMARTGEVPFGRYYGAVDATPLFVMLAGAHHERTADADFLNRIWPHVDAALRWIDDHGDLDGDGFVEYKQNRRGLVQQGWKDSDDSVFHADGSLAEGPIALCEVQGYAYAARLQAAGMACALGDEKRARELEEAAEKLRSAFEDAFWCEELSTYALALDGEKRPCRVRSSNAGHCLLTGIASPQRAARVAETLLHESMFSGWGVRTVASTEVRYNPMSYHNGSIWPHDNALLSAGFARYGLLDGTLKVFEAMFDAASYLDLSRLPELFCGFRRRPGEGPSLYPVACSPQTWSAVSAYLLVQSALGVSVDAAKREIHVAYPVLPPGIRELTIKNFRVRDAVVDMLFQRHGNDVNLTLLRKEGEVRIVMTK